MKQPPDADVRFQGPDSYPRTPAVNSATPGTLDSARAAQESRALPASSTSGEEAELRVRASQIGRMTYRQFDTIRELAVDAGLAPKVAAVTAWLAADPQEAVAQLKRPRMDVIAPGVAARVLDLDVLTAPLVRAPENLRMGGHRYEGDYAMPQYTSTRDNAALLFNLDQFDDAEAAMDFYFTELAKTDHEVREKNKYGDDICRNGIRVGGILFPLLMEFPGSTPGVAGWETADCYGRTFFTQDAEDISSADVLEWMRTVPTDARELARHPLQKRRNALLAVAGKIQSGTQITEMEELRLRRAVMPKTRLIVSVHVDIPLDEIRRRVVSLQHLDRPTPFSAVTDWQTRAEAVLAWFGQKNLLAQPQGVALSTVRQWLDAPAKAVADRECFGDDIAMIAIASMLHSPNSRLDRHVGAALRTRGVTGAQRTNARTEVVAHVICRALPADGRSEGARSAMERVMRWTALRDQTVDMRPVDELLAQASKELEDEAEARSRGRRPIPGAATRQLAARAAFHLICSPAANEPLLRRSSHGAGVGEGIEPGQVLQKLAATHAGLQQLAQAIFDGRRHLPVRRVRPGAAAEERIDAPPKDEQLDPDALRELALTNKPVIADVTAAARVSEDSRTLHDLVEKVCAVVQSMGAHAESSVAASMPYVEDRGWADPHQSIGALQEVEGTLSYWHQVFLVVNRQRPTDEAAVDKDRSR